MSTSAPEAAQAAPPQEALDAIDEAVGHLADAGEHDFATPEYTAEAEKAVEPLERALAALANGPADLADEVETALDKIDQYLNVDWGDPADIVTDQDNPDAVTAAAVSDRPWSDFTAADYNDEQWERACILDRGEGDTAKQRWALPIREPDGTLNRNGVHAAAAALAGARGGVDAPADAKEAAAGRLRSAYRDLGEDPPDSLVASAALAVLRAAADQVLPPASDFTNPHLEAPTPLTVTRNGRVYGHLATWGVCHIGYGENCVTPPKSSTGYAYFMTGEVMVAGGAAIPVGQITLGTGHAPAAASSRAAAAHYDNTGAVVADVCAGEDEYGIWVAGRLRPDTPAEQVTSLRAAALSGDWRRIGGSLELVAALAVNVPGFPIPRVALAASGERQTALVAAGVVRRPGAEDEPEERRHLVASVTNRDWRREKAARRMRGMRVQSAAKKIGSR